MVIEKREKTKISKRWIVIAVLVLLHFYQLPYYYTQPGDTKELAPFVDVENGFKEEEGSLMLTTVKMGRANPYFYAWAHLSEHREVVPEEAIIGPEETDEDYFERQRMMMRNSQEAAKIAAYTHANRNVDIEYHGIMVTTFIEGMPAEQLLQKDDRIRAVDGTEVQTVAELNEIVGGRDVGDLVELTITRQGETMDITVPVALFPEELGGNGRAGLGILHPVVDRTIQFTPPVTIDVAKIGGPSAGLMFSLEIVNQLTENDITKGYQIAGTGTINEKGEVGRIGGAGQKVVAAHKAKADIFFVPKEKDRKDSNYHEALEVAQTINTTMRVVGVNTLEEAIQYLENLPPKSG
ncbi:SepM family pheromone-processing serine protease [Bacillus alkalicellulosilyticus]|uniref:SepM family pheromone-processing serine protease n=1 Tax=Alkalihalobacterium alkalicellulosilyticum TaxID=1912214 RepID=UPI000997E288|nr:SepM family pheromone-processing serine protease [Bacillus alkalicellulosilyticus]